jgi:hypothetical protein
MLFWSRREHTILRRGLFKQGRNIVTGLNSLRIDLCFPLIAKEGLDDE